MTSKKMTGKPSNATPVSLDDFIAGADPVTAPKDNAVEAFEPKRLVGTPKNPKRSVGKPHMSSGEVRNRTIQITLTENELAALKKRAGKVPVSTFVRDEMKNKEII